MPVVQGTGGGGGAPTWNPPPLSRFDPKADPFTKNRPTGLPPSGIIPVAPTGSVSLLAMLGLTVAAQTTSNTVKKYLPFTASNGSSVFTVDVVDTTMLRVSGGFAAFQISGVVNWAQDADGYRLLTLEPFSNTGAALTIINLLNVPGNAVAVPNVTPFIFSYPNTGAAYFKIGATQTSGGDLQVSANLSISIL